MSLLHGVCRICRICLQEHFFVELGNISDAESFQQLILTCFISQTEEVTDVTTSFVDCG